MSGLTIEQAIEESLEPMMSDRRFNTARSYRLGLRYFLEFLDLENIKPTDDISCVTPEHFIKFIPYLAGKYKNSTTLVYVSGAQNLCDYLVIAGILDINHRQSLRMRKALIALMRGHRQPMVRIPTTDELSKLREAAAGIVNGTAYGDPETLKLRNYAMVLFLLKSGVRVSEATHLLCGDLDLVERTAFVNAGKGKKDRTVHFTNEVVEALQAYWTKRGWSGPKDPVFCRHDKGAGQKHKPISTAMVRIVMKMVKDAAGINTKLTPHTLRHIFATLALRETGNLSFVQLELGHEDPKTTAKFYATLDDVDRSQIYRAMNNDK